MKDLVILVADKNMEYTARGLLGRPQALEIEPVEWDLFVHPRRDPGCLNEAHDFLRPFSHDYRFAMVLFDHHGSGQEGRPAAELVARVQRNLARNGWADRARVVVLDPELEVWVWSNSPSVDECLGWAGHRPPLREWLSANGHWPDGATKPPDPKGAMEAALRHARKPRSSAIYLNLASRVSLRGCADPAFHCFVHTLQEWFPS